jgi:hypothetical protein
MDSNSLSEFDSDSLCYSEEDLENDLENILLSPNTSTLHPRHSIRARIQAVIFLDLKIPQPEITTRTGISKSQIYALRIKTINCGWVFGIVNISHVEDAPRAGQLKTSQDIIDSILKTVTQNSVKTATEMEVRAIQDYKVIEWNTC